MATTEQLGKEVSARNRSAASRPICLLVLGMHRSGTSALTRVLSIAGAALPADLAGATEANENGHWESRQLFEYHDQMLAELGSSWDDWRALDFSRLTSARRAEIRREIAAIIDGQFSAAPMIVVKDPRVCRFASLFLEAIASVGYDAKIIVAFRSPLEVVDSLARRDDMPRAKAALLWLRHVLDADAAVNASPHALISYDALLTDWEAALAHIGDELDVRWPFAADEVKPQIDAFLSAAQRHHKSKVEDVLLDTMLRGWVSDVYSALLVLEKNPMSAPAHASIESVRSAFDAAAPIMHRLLQEAERARAEDTERHAAELATAARTEAEMRVALVEAQSARAELSATAEALLADVTRRGVELSAVSARLDQARSEIAQLGADLSAKNETISRLNNDALALKAAADDRAREAASAEAALAEMQAASGAPGDFRQSFVRPLATWFLEGQPDGAPIEHERFVDWLAPNFQSYGDGDVWRINPNGVELTELVDLFNQAPEASTDETARHMRPTKNLLLVSEYAPSFAHAGGLRVRDIYAEIKRLRPDIKLALYCPSAPAIDGDIDWLGEIFDDVFLTTPENFSFVDFVQRAGGARHYDLIDFQFHRAGRLISSFARIGDRTLFTPMETLSRSMFEQARSGLKRDHAIQFRAIAGTMKTTLDELRIVAKADETVCVSDADSGFLQKLAPWRRVSALPTGLSDSEFADQLAADFQPKPPSTKAKRLVFAAYFGSDTNRVGLSWYLDHVHPHVLRHCPDYKLSVVGRGDLSAFIASNPQNVTFVGEVPTMPPVLEQARAGLVLALHGSGFRGKINQYAVCGLPSISTALGITGLAYTSGVDIEVADDPHEFALACVRVLSDDAYADQLAAKARATALENYRWERMHDDIRRIYGL